MDKLEVKLEGDQKELIIREGAAPKVRQPNGYTIDTTPAGIIDFYLKRKESITASNALLKIMDNDRSALLVVNDTIDDEKISITGKIRANKDITDLGINSDKFWSAKELELALRRRPHLFTDSEHYANHMNRFRDFNAEVSRNIQDKDSQRGNAVKSRESNVKHNLESNITLKISPWSDAEARTYTVDIMVKEEAGEARFYLECSQLLVDQEDIASEILKKVEVSLAELPILHC